MKVKVLQDGGIMKKGGEYEVASIGLGNPENQYTKPVIYMYLIVGGKLLRVDRFDEKHFNAWFTII